MTYISRKSRIIVSRWLDECDAEYWLKVSRKRSDGRLKRYSSCDDLRAWISNNCVKNEHLVELMSDGENSKRANSGVFGRIVPVPLLFKLLQPINQTAQRGEKKFYGSSNVDKTGSLENLVSGDKNENYDGNPYFEGHLDEEFPIKKSDSDLSLILCENFLLERRLLKCTNLLNKAVEKLEKIDDIVCLVGSDSEITRNEEIHEAISSSRSRACSNPCSIPSSCSQWNSDQQNSGFLSSSNSYLRKLKESAKCKELTRKISCLQKKLKKVNEHRQKVDEEIQEWQKKIILCSCPTQVTELYNHQDYFNKKKMKLERLIAEKGRILSELCQALQCLKTLKKNSKSNVLWRKKSPWTSGNEDDCRCGESEKWRSGTFCCQSSDNRASSDYDGATTSVEDPYIRDAFNIVNRQVEESKDPDSALEPIFRSSQSSHRTEIIAPEAPINLGNTESAGGTYFLKNNFVLERAPGQGLKSPESSIKTSVDKNVKLKSEESSNKNTTKSKLKFVCPETECEKRDFMDFDDLLNFNPKQQSILNAYKNKNNFYFNYTRPSTSPTTRAEKLGRSSNENRRNLTKSIPRRRVKSETTMKEIEKALRNYEDRLECIGDLEYKIEELKHKLIDWCRIRKKWAKQKNEERRLRMADKEKSNRVITKLCSENWELKRKVQELTEKFESQCKKIQNLSSKRARELENETEVLKKELTEYQNGYEQQRKCISEWESVVAEQKTEIEKLTNHIRNLRSKNAAPCQQNWGDNKNVQRSRSFSPDAMKGRQSVRQKSLSRGCRISSEEDTDYCCCSSCQPRSTMCNPLRNTQRIYSPPSFQNRIKCCYPY